MRKPVLTIELPLPPQELRPNARVHWAKKASKAREYRSRARWAAFTAIGELGDVAFGNPSGDLVSPFPIEQPVVRVTMLNKTARKMDQDNLIASMKSAMDGLTDAGVWNDDREVTILSPIRGKDATNPRIIIEIWI
jgi:hypothetical protein